MELGIFAKTFTQTGAYEVLSAVHEAGFACAQFNFACLGLPSMPDSIDANVPLTIAHAGNRAGVAIAAADGARLQPGGATDADGAAASGYGRPGAQPGPSRQRHYGQYRIRSADCTRAGACH